MFHSRCRTDANDRQHATRQEEKTRQMASQREHHVEIYHY
jgi:hypothetical protein